METKKVPLNEAEKIVQAKREKAQQAKPTPRPLNEDERHFVESWCVHMRPIEQAMLMYSLIKDVESLKKGQSGSGLVSPDGSKL